jgi:hypothetical protein
MSGMILGCIVETILVLAQGAVQGQCSVDSNKPGVTLRRNEGMVEFWNAELVFTGIRHWENRHPACSVSAQAGCLCSQ